MDEQQHGDADATRRVRGGEAARLWYRSERIFNVDQAWYFHTREGTNVGPFRSQFDAEMEAGILTTRLKETPPSEALEVIRDHVLDAQSGAGTLNTVAFTDYLVASGGVELLNE